MAEAHISTVWRQGCVFADLYKYSIHIPYLLFMPYHIM